MEFAAKNNKSYNSASHYRDRKGKWKGAMWKVAALNSSGGDASFAVNFTADLDDNEYM
jgi:hypothetical protein